jgi:endonuclease/exonuclease/phosphatase (EEP) superfamily protein YafD
MDWNGQTVTLDNVHTIPTTSSTIRQIQQESRYRAAQAQALVDLAHRSGPLIATGDANATPLTEAYQVITRELDDAWTEAGFGWAIPSLAVNLAALARA